jgi:hypothetical protein
LGKKREAKTAAETAATKAKLEAPEVIVNEPEPPEPYVDPFKEAGKHLDAVTPALTDEILAELNVRVASRLQDPKTVERLLKMIPEETKRKLAMREWVNVIKELGLGVVSILKP